MDPRTIPLKLDLKKDHALDVQWQDGRQCRYSISYLRSMCPCAQCRAMRDEQKTARKKLTLTILPGNYAGQLTATAASMVGNYALKIQFSDGHDSGIFSFAYLREICPQ